MYTLSTLTIALSTILIVVGSTTLVYGVIEITREHRRFRWRWNPTTNAGQWSRPYTIDTEFTQNEK